jgi:hypothetical protein
MKMAGSSSQTGRYIPYVIQAFLALAFTVVRFHYVHIARFEALSEFQMAAPFSYRVLVPAIDAAITSLIPISHYWLEQVWSTLTVFATMLCMTRLFKDYRKKAPWLATLILWPMIFNYIIYGEYLTPYDLPSMLFFTLGLIMLRSRWLPLLIVIATFNRETALMIPLAFAAVMYKQIPTSEWLKSCSAYVGLWLITKVLITFAFPGIGPAESVFDPTSNIDLLLHLNIVWALTIFGGLHLVYVFCLLKAEGSLLRLALPALIFVIINFFTATFLEERIFNELIPIFVLTIVYVILKKTIDQPNDLEPTPK